MFNQPTDVFTASLRARLTGEPYDPPLLTLAQTSAVLEAVGVTISATSLRRYANGTTEPTLPATLRRNVWYVAAADVYRWLVQYLRKECK